MCRYSYGHKKKVMWTCEVHLTKGNAVTTFTQRRTMFLSFVDATVPQRSPTVSWKTPHQNIIIRKRICVGKRWDLECNDVTSVSCVMTVITTSLHVCISISGALAMPNYSRWKLPVSWLVFFSACSEYVDCDDDVLICVIRVLSLVVRNDRNAFTFWHRMQAIILDLNWLPVKQYRKKFIE